jgi:SAM-dependent methyltransferase
MVISLAEYANVTKIRSPRQQTNSVDSSSALPYRTGDVRFTTKLKKLASGEGFSSATRHVRQFFVDLVSPSRVRVDEIIASIDSDAFREICRRYAVKKPGGSPRKYLDLKWWIRVNAARVRELRLDSPPRLRILDLGSGAGYFVYLCRRLGHDAIGLDIDKFPMYRELTKLLDVPRITWRIEPFVPLPDLGEPFDLITGFLVAFNNFRDNKVWGVPEWDFFLSDLARHLTPQGRVRLELNRQPDGKPFSPEVRRFFESRGGKIDIYRVDFKPGRLAPSSISPAAR